MIQSTTSTKRFSEEIQSVTAESTTVEELRNEKIKCLWSKCPNCEGKDGDIETQNGAVSDSVQRWSHNYGFVFFIFLRHVTEITDTSENLPRMRGSSSLWKKTLL
ncbi:hypothetical protein CHARACLAT_031196 [Characodon lateralis]|uniref:Uncharacterized protein n=1 Tax=Characodon lateralis TaxID=208331 RepID=A0ABU7E6G6_9TELE|nr:hypothetical protein [Characodon lateralis]